MCEISGRRPWAATALLVLSVSSLAACASGPTVTASADIRDQVVAFQDRIERIIWSRPSPSSLWHQLDPASAAAPVALADHFSRSTDAPYPFAHEIEADVLTVEIFASSESRSSGADTASDAWRYACATFVVHPRDQEVTRAVSECPAGLLPPSGEAVARDDLTGAPEA